METGSMVAALGDAGELRIWGAAVFILSAGILAHRIGNQQNLPVDDRVADVSVDRARAGRIVDVCTGAAVAGSA